MVITIGDCVEVIGTGSVASKSYYTARVLGIDTDNVSVVYDTLTDGNGEGLIVSVPRSRIRPLPVEIAADSFVGDVVDVWDHGGWWVGIVEAVSDVAYNVVFGYMEEAFQHGRYLRGDVRINQMFHLVDGEEFWLYRRLPSTLLEVSDRMEVIGTGFGGGKDFANSTVVHVGEAGVFVVYESLRNNRDEPSVDLVDADRLRPCPLDFEVGFVIGDVVDVWENGRWWQGIIDGAVEEGYDVFFPYMEEGLQHCYYRKDNVRVNQVHQHFEGANYWLYRRV